MQPIEPGSDRVPPPGPVPVGAPVTGSGVPPSGKRPNRRLRLALAMGAGVLALLCLGGVGVFISLFDETTNIDRAEPDAVADSFLRAYLVERNDEEVALFTCRSGADLSSVAALRAESLKRERDFDVKVVITWRNVVVIGDGETRRQVTAELVIAGTLNGVIQSLRTEPWSIEVVEDDGWRVCGATKMG